MPDTRLIKHKNCGHEVTIAVQVDDVAIYVYCDYCGDIVEDGELLVGPLPLNEIRLVRTEQA